jgi:AraC-like DNA-binding protein
MTAVAALLERRAAMPALRQSLPRAAIRLLAARSPAHLAQLLQRHYFDAIVIGGDTARGPVLEALRRDFGAIPLLVYLPLRADDGDLLRRLRYQRVAAVLIEGIDEPVAATTLRRHGLAARRYADLEPLAAALDLTDPIQRQAWRAIIGSAQAPIDTKALATRFGLRRETLSRRFGAGAAPSLKRAIDACRLVVAGQLLANTGYRVDDAARLLGFSSVALLQHTARRTFGVSARSLSALDPERVCRALRVG